MADRPVSNIARLRTLGMSPSEILLDLLIREHAELLADIEDGEVELVKERMADLESTLAARVSAMLEAEGASRPTIKRLNDRIETIKAVRRRNLSATATALEDGAERAAKRKASGIRSVVRMAADEVEGLTGFGIPSAQQLAQVAKRDFLGATVRRWVSGRTVVGEVTLEREMRASFFAGDSIPQAVARVRAVLKNDKREAVTIARTVIQGAANQAAVDTYRDNSGVLSGMRWIATLDSRICEECMALDGKVFRLDSDRAPPAHPQCRCFMAPVVKGMFYVKPPTAAEWFGRQDSETHRKVLGKGRADLVFGKSNITLDDVIARDGSIRNLAQLERLNERRGRKAA